MKRILLSTSLILLTITLTSCLKPDALEDTSVSDVYLMDILETTGYARDVLVHADKIYVAASQSGHQIWQDLNGSVEKVFEYSFSTENPALRVHVEPESHLMLAVDKKKIYLKQLNQDLTAFDSVYILFSDPDWIGTLEDGSFYDANLYDFAITPSNDSLLTMISTDTDLTDGLRVATLSRSYEAGFGFYYWEENPINKYSNRPILGIDMSGTLIAAAHDELGVGLYQLNGVDLDTLAVVDTRGESLEVKFYDNYMLSANNWAGMGIFSVESSSLTHIVDVEVGGWVKQISLWNDIAVLSCGENGIFLVDVSDPENPVVDQPIDAGYTYRTHVSGDIIYAATREGVKRYHIESR